MIKKNLSQPLYVQIAHSIKQDIIAGKLPSGSILPPTMKMAEDYGVCHKTVQTAMKALMHEGLLIRRPRHGTTVSNLTGSIHGIPKHEKQVSLLIQFNNEDFLGTFYPKQLINGVMAAAREHNCKVEVNVYSNLDTVSIAPYLHGFLLVLPSREQALKIKRLGLPTVLLDMYFERLRLGYVRTDNVYGICSMVRHLLKLGHKNMLYVRHDSESFHVQERYKAFTHLMKKYENKCQGDIINIKDIESGFDFTPFTAVMTDSNDTMVRTLNVLDERSIQCPDNISVISFDDIDPALRFPHSLTVTRQNLEEIGLIGLNLLLEEGERWRNAKILVKPSMIVRKSTRAVQDQP